jgi:TonB-linked SusC/RagA family outer membrane protein
MKKFWKPPFQLNEKAKKLILTMKLTVFILFLTLMQVSATVYSQATKFSFRAENKQVVEVLQQIEANSDFRFFFLREQVDVERKVTVTAREATVEQILDELFRGEPVSYEFANEALIVLTRSDNPLGSVNSYLQGNMQQPAVSGTVTDESGDPLPGVTVIIKGTTQGTVTNADGNYSLTNIPGDATLVFTFVGMRTQEVVVGGQTTIDVRMEVDAIGIEEVVAVGYGNTKRRDITGSVSTVKNEELTISPITSTTNTLAGRVPGLQTLQISGEPGNDASKLSIRGFGNALVIVDGVEQPFNNISTEEIESISVLKDASAAIYGARAGNGVILIKTKRGKIGKPLVTFNASYTYSGNINYPEPLTAGQYTELFREAQLNSGIAPELTKYSETDIRNYYSGSHPDSTSTNWWDATMNNWSPMQKYDISLSGGNENVRYYGFAGYLRQDGMFKTGDNVFNRFNVRSNIDANVSKNFSIELNLSAIVGERARSAEGIQENEQFWNAFFWAKPTFTAYLPDRSKVAYSGGQLGLNPVILTDKEIGGYNLLNTKNIRGSLGLKYDIPIIKGLNIKAFGDYQYTFTDNKTFRKYVETYTYSYENDTYSKSGFNTNPTDLQETMSPEYLFTGQFSLNYSRSFNEKHEISGLLLYEIIDYYFKNMWAYRRDFLSNSIDYLFAGSPGTQQNSGSATESGRSSVVGRLNYKLNSKYLAEVTLRYDASTTFPVETRWGFFPSISAGWILSEESFIRDNATALSFLKIRGSYSNTGFDVLGDAFQYQYIAGYNMGQRPFALNGARQTGIEVSGIPNPNITWEKMATYNLGLDYTLFNNSLYGEGDIFYRKRDGILGTRVLSLPTTFGATLPSENINSQDTRGFEFLIGYRKNFGGLTMDVSGNISWARSKWIHYDEPDYTDLDDIKINKVSGTWTDIVWGYKTDGLFTSQSEIDNLGYDMDGKENTSVKVGDIKYLNLNGDEKLDWKDYAIIASTGLPKTMFGLNISLSYKNFDFDALLQGATGRSLYALQGLKSEQSTTQNVFKYRWTEENPDKYAIYPRQSFNSNNYGNLASNRFVSDYWYKDASYARLKTVSIGYNFSEETLSKAGISNLRLYISGTNLFTVSGLKKYNIDPEVPGSVKYEGFTVPGAIYPHQRTLSVGMNISF